MDSRIFLAVIVSVTVTYACPDTWIPFHNSCYLFGHNVPMTFYDAEDFCRQHGGHLVHIGDAAENAFIKDHFIRSKAGHDYWIGLTDERVEGLWLWYDTDTSPTFTDWNIASNEPNGGYRESCVDLMAYWNFKWNDEACSCLEEPICEIRKSLSVVTG